MSKGCKQFRTMDMDEWEVVHSPHGTATRQLAEHQPPKGTYQIWIHICPCGARHVTTGDSEQP